MLKKFRVKKTKKIVLKQFGVKKTKKIVLQKFRVKKTKKIVLKIFSVKKTKKNVLKNVVLKYNPREKMEHPTSTPRSCSFRRIGHNFGYSPVYNQYPQHISVRSPYIIADIVPDKGTNLSGP